MYKGIKNYSKYEYPKVFKKNEKRKMFYEKNKMLEFELGFTKVEPMSFYSDLWSDLDLQVSGADYDGKASAIIVDYYKDENIGAYVQKFIVKDDLNNLESCFSSKSPSLVTNGCSYFGKSRSFKNVCKTSCIIIDLDYVDTLSQLKNLFVYLRKFDVVPTYIVNSGTGFHLYYQFEQAIPLYYKYRLFLKEVQQIITTLIWNQYTTTNFDHDKVQYLSVNQGYRMVGSATKLGPTFRCTAFRSGDYIKFSDFNKFVKDMVKSETRMVRRLNLKSLQEIELVLENPKKLKLSEAKILYPDWYQERIVEKSYIKGWQCKRYLYDWWITQLEENEPIVGSRYYRVTALATYAVKCGIGFDEFRNDAEKIYTILNKEDVDLYEPFTKEDLQSAIEFYNNEYIKKLTRITIQKKTKIEIVKNKRNGRTRDVHLQLARSQQELLDKINSSNWRENNGRKSKQELVKEYLEEYENESIKKIAIISGMSKNTIKKWKRIIEERKVNDAVEKD